MGAQSPPRTACYSFGKICGDGNARIRPFSIRSIVEHSVSTKRARHKNKIEVADPGSFPQCGALDNKRPV